MKNRNAFDFLKLLKNVKTDIPINEEVIIVEKIENNNPIINVSINFPEIEITGIPITQNEWFNEYSHDFNQKNKEFQNFKIDDLLVLSTDSKIPINQINLYDLFQNNEYIKEIINNKLISIVFDYKDVLFTSKNYDISQYRKLSALHIVNHIYNDLNIKLIRKEGSQIRDSGFTPTNILIISPNKHLAYQYVMEILKFFPTDFNIEQLDKFKLEYYTEIPSGVLRNRSEDWIQYFGGNNEQDFKTGIRFFKDKISLCQNMSKSQLVIASPLSIMLHEDKSFLSSIEILIFDCLDMLFVQNPQRLKEIINITNLNPLTVQETDWSRLRTYFSDKNHSKMRQNIGYTSVFTPDIHSLFNSFENIRGKIYLKPLIYESILADNIERNFKRIHVPSISKIGEIFFKFFKDKLLPQIKVWRNSSSESSRTLIFFSSSYQFYHARKILDNSNIIFLELADEATEKDNKEMRKSFKQDPNAILLLTERFYFHFRPKFYDVQKVIFFQPPSFPQFVKSLANKIPSVFYYTEYDKFSLERIFGTILSERLIKDEVYKIQ